MRAVSRLWENSGAALMHEAVGPAWLVWLEGSAVAVAMRQWLWLYPAVEIVHHVNFVS